MSNRHLQRSTRYLISRVRSCACMPAHRQWQQAMLAEIDQIDDDWKAFIFALGCVWALWKEEMKMRKFEPFVRYGLGAMMVMWIGAKLYLSGLLIHKGMENAMPIITTCLLMAGIYSGAVVCLFRKKLLTFMAFFLGANIINSLIFGVTSFYIPQAVHAHFLNALAGEDYLLWTMLLVGVVALLLMQGSLSQAEPYRE